jgi:hypothetical protein
MKFKFKLALFQRGTVVACYQSCCFIGHVLLRLAGWDGERHGA